MPIMRFRSQRLLFPFLCPLVPILEQISFRILIGWVSAVFYHQVCLLGIVGGVLLPQGL